MLTLRRSEVALSHVILLVSPGDDSLTAGRDILTGNRSVVTRAQMRLKDRTRLGVDWLDIHVRDINGGENIYQGRYRNSRSTI